MRVLLTYNPWLSVAMLSWLIAQTLKMLIYTLTTRRFDFSRLVDSGGMPSSHTAFVTGLTTAVGITEGMASVAFAITLCFSLIILYDATNLRRSAGYHAQLLNDIVPQLLRGKVIREEFNYRRLRELLGHNPIEVVVGAAVGIAIAFTFFHFLNNTTP